MQPFSVPLVRTGKLPLLNIPKFMQYLLRYLSSFNHICVQYYCEIDWQINNMLDLKVNVISNFKFL